MASINLHFIDARGLLADHRDWLQARLTATHHKASALLPLRPLDVIVKAGSQVIPEKGHLGYAPEPGLIYLTVDPASDVFRANENASLERMFAHELHHAARWDGPGYGSTLGQVLVSEGLAGVFAQEVWGGCPEPWERVDVEVVRRYVDMAAAYWDREDYGHGAWFFGVGELPRWFGYSLGVGLVRRYLREHEGGSAAGLVGVEAGVFRGGLGGI
ncbi:DUF2268 domain-containing putative Zn-dependent protease [Pseudomonas sp. App30]|uniref:DUF2268 domain-containing putative Zn-dependent protease n=1 Tax=Pseudomonas sp. App30 TaxID=3068990 RepID=UPI003A808C52